MRETIKISHLQKEFGGVKAVENLNLEVYPGEIYGLVGPDGAGKTTIMRLLAAILNPTAGDAWVNGKHIVREAEPLKEQIGYMSQRFGLYSDLSVEENIHFYADIYKVPRKGRREKIEQLLSFSNLIPFKKRLAGNLSGGMKQKLGLACALIHTPKVLFLDEPTNGVDPVSRRDFYRILYQLLKEGVTIFLSTAYLDEAERCSRVGFLHHGKLLVSDTPEKLKSLLKGTLLEVRSGDSREGARWLREEFPSASVGLSGDKIHILTLEPEKIKKKTEDLFREKDISFQEIRKIEPSLEDIFVTILSGKKTGEGP